MAKAVVTQELVFQVAESLVAQGVTPTILNVQDGIGGGSYTTVKRYLDQWREAAPKQRRPVELPETAVAKLMNLGCEFWGLLDEQAGQQVEAIRAATGEEIAAIQAQLDQAEQAIAKLEAERDQAESRAVEQEQALREAVQARQAQTEHIAATQAKAEELVARVADLKGEGVLVAMEQGTRIGVRHALRHRQSSIAGSRRGRKAPFATASGIVREYRPCMLIWSWICGDKRATSSMRTSNPSLRSCSRATSM
jgi:hypothetical protein